MPFAGYENFDACLLDQKGKGHDDDSAHKICGALQAQADEPQQVAKKPKMQRKDEGEGYDKVPHKIPEGGPQDPQRPIVTASKEAPLYGEDRTKEPPKPLYMSLEMQAVDEYTRSIPILASTPNAPGDGQPAIKEWDLSRFLKNPVILWAHDQAGENLPIGYACDIEVGPEGLKMRAKIATEKASPLAEQIWHGVKEKIIRAVSIGYELVGPNKAKLLEVSFVPVGLDEDAGTTDLNPEAADDGVDQNETDMPSSTRGRKNPVLPDGDEPMMDDEKMLSLVKKAASTLASHRARIIAKRKTKNDRTRKRMDSADFHKHRDASRLDADIEKFATTPTGGRKIPARLSRVGVLEYRNPDGTTRRELRLPEEVFNKDSLASLDIAPVIDIRDHTDMATPESWQRSALGVVTKVEQDGDFITGLLHINDRETLDAIANDERTEISLGYTCRLEHKPGTWRGQNYDFIQRDIEYNHAALCPPNRGRAGPEVGLRFDANETHWATARIDQETTMPDAVIVKLRLDGKDYVVGSPEHVEKLNADIQHFDAKHKEVTAKLLAETQRADSAEGARDGFKAQLDQFNADAKKAKEMADEQAEKDEEERKRSARGRRRLERFVLRYFGGQEDEEDEDDDDDDDDGDDDDDKKKGKRSKTRMGEKVVANDEYKIGVEKKSKRSKRGDSTDLPLFDRLDSMSDREVMLFAIRKHEKNFNDEGKSDEYVRARFDATVETVRSSRRINGVVAGLHNAVQRDAGRTHRTDSTDSLINGVVEARMKMEQWAHDVGRQPPGGSSKGGE